MSRWQMGSELDLAEMALATRPLLKNGRSRHRCELALDVSRTGIFLPASPQGLSVFRYASGCETRGG